jgi:glycerol-3-phosphate dehydrogenase
MRQCRRFACCRFNKDFQIQQAIATSPNAQSTHTTQITPLYRITETHLETNMKNKKARKKYKSVRPLLSSPILDEEVPTPMENTSASRPTKTQARNAEMEEVEESASRKRPFEGLGLYMPEDVQP